MPPRGCRMAYTILNGKIKHTLSPSKFKKAMAEIEDSRVCCKERLAELRECISQGDEAGQRQLRNLIISDPKLILWPAVTANLKLKLAKRQPLEECFHVANSLKLGEPLTEEVLVHPQKKKSGGARAICEFGIWHRTAQELMLSIMGCYLHPQPFQHKGVASAIAAAKQAIGMGFLHAVRIDVRKFYESFELEKLSPILPLSPEVVEHAVLGRYMKVKGAYVKDLYSSHSSWIALLSQSRRGLPQGSTCSPIIGSFSLSHLKWSFPAGVMLINYVDDFLLLAKSPELLETAKGELVKAIAELPGGNFVPTIMEEG